MTDTAAEIMKIIEPAINEALSAIRKSKVSTAITNCHGLIIGKRVISALTEAGLAIRPIEPTFDMVSEGGLIIWEHASEEKHQKIVRVWKAMIGAGHD